MRYKSVIVTRRGSPKAFEIIENDLRAPISGEVRIRILATVVCNDDIGARIGNRPVLPKIPFVPGEPFHPTGGGHNTMRINFSNASPE